MYFIPLPASDTFPQRWVLSTTPTPHTVIPPQAQQPLHLKLFHLNDFHHALTEPARLTQLATVLQQARQTLTQTVLFVSAGDDHIGTPYDELLGTSVTTFQCSAVYRLYTALGLDVATLGNHDFDRGTAVLQQAIAQDADFPVLCANFAGFRTLTSFYPAFIGVTQQGWRLGFLGLTTVTCTALRTEVEPDAYDLPLDAVLGTFVPTLQANCDVLIVLSHLGYNETNTDNANNKVEWDDTQLAQHLSADVEKPCFIVGAHSHTVLNQHALTCIQHGLPILQAGAHGRYLGQYTLELALDGRVQNQQACLLPLTTDKTANSQYHADIAMVMEPLQALLLDTERRVIGYTRDATQLTPEVVLRQRYCGQTALHNFMNDAVLARQAAMSNQSRIDIVAFDSSGVSDGVVAHGALRVNDWYRVMPYSDSIVLIYLRGWQLQQLLHSNAQRLVRPEQLQAQGGELDSTALSGYDCAYGFLHFSKTLRYTIRLDSCAAEARAEAIHLHGKPLAEQLEQTFCLAVGDYLAVRGGGKENWRGQTRTDGRPAVGFDLTALPQENTGLLYRHEVMAYIETVGEVSAATGAVIDERLVIEA